MNKKFSPQSDLLIKSRKKISQNFDSHSKASMTLQSQRPIEEHTEKHF